MLYVPSFCVSTLQSTQFMSIPFRGFLHLTLTHLTTHQGRIVFLHLVVLVCFIYGTIILKRVG